jgi:hypothetical protein
MLPILDALRTYRYTSRVEIPGFLATYIVQVPWGSPSFIIDRTVVHTFFSESKSP